MRDFLFRVSGAILVLAVVSACSSSSEPKTQVDYRALAAVTDGCLAGDSSSYDGFLSDDPSFLYFPSRRWHGVVLQHAIEEGALSGKKLQNPVFMDDLKLSSYITQSLEMAATLDNRWLPLQKLWVTGGSAAVKSWDRGADSLSALDATANASERLVAQCRVAVSEALVAARTAGLKLGAWVDQELVGLQP